MLTFKQPIFAKLLCDVACGGHLELSYRFREVSPLSTYVVTANGPLCEHGMHWVLPLGAFLGVKILLRLDTFS